MRKALELGALNALSYFVLTWDLRTVAQASYAWAALANLVIALLGFSVLKRVQEADGNLARGFYAVGGTVGTMAGIWTSLAVLGR